MASDAYSGRPYRPPETGSHEPESSPNNGNSLQDPDFARDAGPARGLDTEPSEDAAAGADGDSHPLASRPKPPGSESAGPEGEAPGGQEPPSLSPESGPASPAASGEPEEQSHQPEHEPAGDSEQPAGAVPARTPEAAEPSPPAPETAESEASGSEAQQHEQPQQEREEAAGAPSGGQPPSLPGLPQEAPPGAEPEAEAEAAEAADYEQLIEEYSAPPEAAAGDVCRGTVVSLTPQGAIIDFGSKTEGLVPPEDFVDEAGQSEIEPGQQIDVLVEATGQPGEYAQLSYRRAKLSAALERIEQAYRSKAPVEARVAERVKGGLQVDIGVPAFLPASHADLRPVPDLDALVGQEFPVRVVKLNRRRGNVVVSRRELLEEELAALKRETVAKLAPGAVNGTVKNITSYGAFIDLGGIDGLLHLTDMSWQRIKSPAEAVRAGQEIDLKVLKYEAGSEHVSLSLKHLTPDPWEGIGERYRPGQRVKGKVASINDYGAFVEIEEGVEGLIHITEMSWSRRLRHPSKVLSPGSEVEAVILKVDPRHRRVSLSLKQTVPDPWTTAAERYQAGAVVEGRVRKLVSYGAFVEIEEGVEGLIHISDLSWSNRLKHPNEVLKKGQQVRAVILQVDAQNRRLSLGLKQLEPDAWDEFFSTHLVGDIVRGAVTRHAKFGAFVEVSPGVEGLCHNSEMKSNPAKGRGSLEVGREYDFKIVKLDQFDRRIGLSRKGLDV